MPSDFMAARTSFMMREFSLNATVLSGLSVRTLNVMTASSGLVLIVAVDDTVMVCGDPSPGDESWPEAWLTRTAARATVTAVATTPPPTQARVRMASSCR
jgi:hypothetical protein